MKHKKIYQEATNLIVLREQKATNLVKAEKLLAQLLNKDATCAWAYGLLAQIYYWQGEVAYSSERVSFYEQGVIYGKQGVEIEAQSLEANFWLAVNYGLLGKEKGVLASLGLIDLIEEHAARALAMDGSYFYGGPWRLLGRFYHQLHGWPISRGDNKKALTYLQSALKHGAKFYLNHLYIAELYLTLKDKAKAREHLQWIIQAPLSLNHENEDSRYKEEAKKLLKHL